MADAESEQETPGATTIPSGKIWYLWKVQDLLGGDLDKITQRALDTGVSAVLVKAADGVNPYNLTRELFPKDSILGPLIEKLHLAGIECWGWQYLYGTNPAGEADRAITRLGQFPWDGWVLDPEKEYKLQPGNAARAKLYVDTVKTAYPKLCIGLSSYRYPSLHPELPWGAFLTGCNFVMPQVYWMGSHNPGYQLSKTILEYQALYARLSIEPLPMIPTGAAFHEWGWQPTKEDITAFDAKVKEFGLVGAAWWEWAAAYRYGLEDTVANLDWPPPPPFEPPPPLPPPEPPGPPPPTSDDWHKAIETWAIAGGYTGPSWADCTKE